MHTKYQKQIRQKDRLIQNQTKKVRLRVKAWAKKELANLENINHFSKTYKYSLQVYYKSLIPPYQENNATTQGVGLPKNATD